MGLRLVKWGFALFAVGMAASSCSEASQVRQIFMSLDTNGDRPRDIFYTDTKQISCDVIWVGRSVDTTVDAFIKRISSPDGSPPAMMAAGEQPGTEGSATMSFTWTSQSPNGGGTAPFPIGHYECDITVNGDSAGAAQFDILYPPKDSAGHECPASGAAEPGSACQGWVEPGSTCPSAPDLTQTCTCTGATWTGC